MKNNIPLKVSKEIAILDTIVDSLDTPIDSKVKFIVATLRLNGFITTGSCAGHKDDRTPWIDIASKEYLEFDNSKVIKDLIELMHKETENQSHFQKYYDLAAVPSLANLKEGLRLITLLNQFYHKRSSNEEVHLILETLGWQGLGGIRLRPQGDIFINLKNKEDKSEWLKRVRAEMDAFAEFLFMSME